MDPEGMRQSLMARELCDLPHASLEYALAELRRTSRFFPKPAEIRELAEPHAREHRRLAREQEEQERLQRSIEEVKAERAIDAAPHEELDTAIKSAAERMGMA